MPDRPRDTAVGQHDRLVAKTLARLEALYESSMHVNTPSAGAAQPT
jgi:hypothetical protein